jgi:hypothetical protein
MPRTNAPCSSSNNTLLPSLIPHHTPFLISRPSTHLVRDNHSPFTSLFFSAQRTHSEYDHPHCQHQAASNPLDRRLAQPTKPLLPNSIHPHTLNTSHQACFTLACLSRKLETLAANTPFGRLRRPPTSHPASSRQTIPSPQASTLPTKRHHAPCTPYLYSTNTSSQHSTRRISPPPTARVFPVPEAEPGPSRTIHITNPILILICIRIESSAARSLARVSLSALSADVHDRHAWPPGYARHDRPKRKKTLLEERLRGRRLPSC